MSTGQQDAEIDRLKRRIAELENHIEDQQYTSPKNDFEADVIRIRNLIADDAYCCTFQSVGQYRTALLKSIDRCEK